MRAAGMLGVVVASIAVFCFPSFIVATATPDNPASPFHTGNKKKPTFLTTKNQNNNPHDNHAPRTFLPPRGGSTSSSTENDTPHPQSYGRISQTSYRLTPEQITQFHQEGCITLPNVLTPTEVDSLQTPIDQLLQGQIPIPGKDYCDMSKPFGVPPSEWSIVNCMLPTRYHPPLQNNIYELLTRDIVAQLYPDVAMQKDYDQLLNKHPGKTDAVFAWHQDMAYWPSAEALGMGPHGITTTATFSLALDDSTLENGCLRYVVGSGMHKTLRPHSPLVGNSRDEGHALTTQVGGEEGPYVQDVVAYAPAARGSVTVHDEWVVHGSGGNRSKTKQRRTYVLAYRAKEVVEAERRLGFTHSHNDEVNWDSFHEEICKKKKNEEEGGGGGAMGFGSRLSVDGENGDVQVNGNAEEGVEDVEDGGGGGGGESVSSQAAANSNDDDGEDAGEDGDDDGDGDAGDD